MTWREVIIEETDRLIGEYPEVPAGSVLRCFARALRVARLHGGPPTVVLSAAVEATRNTLRLRGRGSTQVATSPRVTGQSVAQVTG